jgi:putative phosphoesterase
MRVVLVSDTHVKSRAAALPEWVREEIRAADHAIHAGDFDSRPAFETIESLAADLTAVAGNMDRRLELPRVATADLGGVRFVVTHGAGPEEGYERRVAETVADHAAEGPTVGVAGHTHDVIDRTVDGYRLLNPGSATGAWPAQRETLMVAEADDGTLSVSVRHGGS